MPRPKSIDAELLELGARARYAELQQEMNELVRRFPALRNGHPKPETPPARTRKGMSAKERAAVSRRMRAYWKARRAEKTKAAKP